MREVLVVYYSQTGQLTDILKNVVSKIEDKTINVTYYKITPKTEFPFPWPSEKFFDVFPETFLQIPTALEDIPENIMQKKYDLIILGYSVWYLSPSVPINSFLMSSEGKLLLKNTPVITVSGSRNMWIMAQEKIKKALVANEALLVGNIALVDRNINHISVLTIVHWLLGGKKTRMFGILPKPGVSDRDITEASKFGIPIKAALLLNDYSQLQNNLLNIGAVRVDPSLIATDIRGNMVFSKWANLLIKKQGDKRREWLVYFNFYLLFAIWIIAPIVFIVFLATYIFNYRKIKRDIAYYSSVALKQD